MRKFWSLLLRIAALMMLLLTPITAFAALVSGSTGADGAFSPTANITVPLPESGVLNYTTVNIPSNVTVYFQKNSRNTPVTILATGDVTINGSINVSGSNASGITPGAGGPGGFDGGAGGGLYSGGYRGRGPGGGGGGSYGGFYGGGGGSGTAGDTANDGAGGIAYGNDGQLPQIGGSGGGGGGGRSDNTGYGGGGGGGAILIASSGTITVNGSIYANGGSGGMSYDGYYGIYRAYGAGGAGGTIRLVATTIAGNGGISVSGANGGYTGSSYTANGGTGRIRLEAWNLARTSQTNPNFSFLANPSAVTPAVMPTLAIASVGGVATPAVPKGNTQSPDIQLPANATNPVTIVVNAANIPVGTTVTVKSLSSIGNTVTTASAGLSGADASSTTASVSLNLPVAAYPSLITVSATYTAVASNGAPLYAEGERVERIRIDAAMGGGPIVTYITASGREIPVKPS